MTLPPGTRLGPLRRAEILTFAGAPDAKDVVRSLFARAADGMFHNAPYPVKLAHAYHLQRAYDAGWRDGRTLAIDPLFTSVRAEPGFAQLLSRIQADVAAMRTRADYSDLP
jgi:hypothetical protein